MVVEIEGKSSQVNGVYNHVFLEVYVQHYLLFLHCFLF